jgi:hypothetical protein
MNNPFFEHRLNVNRRHFLSKMSVGLGSVALGSLLIKDLFKDPENAADSIINGLPHFAPKGKKSHLSVSEWSAFATGDF